MSALLEVKDLRTSFKLEGGGEFSPVDGVSFSVEAGRTLGIVGESGCGKSVTSLSIMGLLPKGQGRISAGSVVFEGRDLATLNAEDMRSLRGNRMAMIFQEPMTSLNPAFTIGQQLIEGIRCHQNVTAEQARELAIDMLRLVRIPSPEQRIDEYPHKLSGGMRQRVMIAMALSCRPKLLIADEPTTALDVTIQAQVLDLMRSLREETGTAIILITHDLGVIAELADDVVVMYAGRVVERAPVAQLFAMPQHPYTIGLLGSIPKMHGEQDRLNAIEGQVPTPMSQTRGCRFAPRCPFAVAQCQVDMPLLREVAAGHEAACWRAPLDAWAQVLPQAPAASFHAEVAR
jgi:peptide/nickel transport system ATP-binding protein